MTDAEQSERIAAAVAHLNRARAEARLREVMRDELLLELVGDTDTVPLELARAFELEGRNAAAIVRRYRRRQA